jgi:hypothetical protein
MKTASRTRLKQTWWWLRGLGGPRDFREISTGKLRELTDQAIELQLKAGRPEWLKAYEPEIERAVVHFGVFEGTPRFCFRCRVVIFTTNGLAAWFALDMLPDQYFGLPRMSGRQVRMLAFDLAHHLPMVLLTGDEGKIVDLYGWLRTPT